MATFIDNTKEGKAKRKVKEDYIRGMERNPNLAEKSSFSIPPPTAEEKEYMKERDMYGNPYIEEQEACSHPKSKVVLRVQGGHCKEYCKKCKTYLNDE